MILDSWHHLLKGKFLEGKRNRRMDHLIHTLVHDVVPFYKAKHSRQEWGFEGLDLEMKRRKEIEVAAAKIPFDAITDFEDDDEPGQFTVQSQKKPNHVYFIDVDAYTCDCESYPLISYCKHLAAVQLHIYENIEIKPMGSLFTNKNSILTRITTSGHETKAAPTVITTPLPPNPDLPILATIPEKLQRLAVRTQLSPPQDLTDTLRQLDGLLDRALVECAQPQVLPRHKKVPSNQHSWPETAKVMGAAVKTKRKSVHTDPYSGKEKSGKRAKSDARAPLVVQGKARYVHLHLCSSTC